MSKVKSSSNHTSSLASKLDQEVNDLRKVQISLDFPEVADTLLRTLAAHEHKAPSAMIREILGMPSSPPKRARIGVSFNDHELAELGVRYGVDPTNKAEIRRKLTQEVTAVLSTSEFTGITKVGRKPIDLSFQNHLAEGAIKDLQAASDCVYERFQQALATRKKK